MPRLRHFLIQGTAQSQSYVATFAGRGDFKTPPRIERVAHGARVAGEVQQAARQAHDQPEKPAEGVGFVPLAIRSNPGFKLWLDSLDDKKIGSEIINFRYQEDGSERAIVHIPNDKVAKFAKKFEDYAHKDHKRYGSPLNQTLAESVNEIRVAMLRDGDYWTDSGPVPQTDEEFWWEVWLRDEGEILLPDGRFLPVEDVFREEANRYNIRVSNQQVRFELENFLDFLLVFRLSEVSGSSFRRTWVTCECFAVPASARPACLAPLAVV